MAKEIYILPSVEKKKKGYEFLCGLYDDMHSVENMNIVIDFSKCRSFDANLSAVLGAIFDKRQEEGCSIFLKSPQTPGVRRALSRNKFFNAFDLETYNENRENYIEYHKFSVSDTQQFKKYVNSELIQKKRFPACTENAKIKIIESIYEIFANAASHGGCSYVYSCGEVHTRNNKTMLDMTFVNLGRSVVDNVNKYMQERGFSMLESCATLEWAFVEGNTTKSITGGLGLSILRNFIGLNEGTIQMISKDAMLEINGNECVKTQMNRSFCGTIVTVEFNCDDNKTYLSSDELPDKNNLF